VATGTPLITCPAPVSFDLGQLLQAAFSANHTEADLSVGESDLTELEDEDKDEDNPCNISHDNNIIAADLPSVIFPAPIPRDPTSATHISPDNLHLRNGSVRQPTQRRGPRLTRKLNARFPCTWRLSRQRQWPQQKQAGNTWTLCCLWMRL